MTISENYATPFKRNIQQSLTFPVIWNNNYCHVYMQKGVIAFSVFTINPGKTAFIDDEVSLTQYLNIILDV